MIPTCADKIAFATRHFKSPKGDAFDVTPPGRAWVVEELFRPADGYRVVARDVQRLCEECKNRVEKIADRWEWRLQDAFDAHREDQTACLGVDLKPILVTIVNYPRRGGKSFNTYSWLFATLCLTKRRRACVIAASEDQVKRIVKENIHEMVAQSPFLAERVKITPSAGLIEIPGNLASIRVWTASAKSIAGSSYAYILLDEAATTDPAPFIKLIFSAGDAGRLECPRGCAGKPALTGGRRTCSSCGDRLIPWHPRLIIFSSSGVLTGDSYSDWFQELIEQLEAHPHAQAHVYRSEVNTNPDVDPSIASAFVEIFGRVDALKTLVEVEASNVARSLSDDFLSSAQVRSSLDANWRSVDVDERPCIGFLDTSVSNDLTSLWVMVDNVRCASEPSDVGLFRPWSQYPWEQLRCVHLKIWDPKDLAAVPGGVIDAAVVKKHFTDVLIPGFPNLRTLVVDTRGSAWAKMFTVEMQQLPVFGRKIKLMHKLRDESGERIGVDLPEFAWGLDDKKTAWDLMITRIAFGKLWLPGGPVGDRLVREFRGVVRDPKTGVYRDKSKSTIHADLTDAIACACLLAHREQTLKVRGDYLRDVQIGTAAHRALRQIFRSPVADLIRRP